MYQIVDFNIGEKFAIDNTPYIMTMIEDYYYLVNLITGSIWTSGMDFKGMIRELNLEGFKQL